MKRLLFSFLFILTAIAGWAQEPTTFTVDNFKYTVTDDENLYVSIAKADEATFNSALVIPSSVVYETVTYTVTSVGASGFYETGITSVTIPASVMTIGDAAFQSCGSLASITIEDSETPLTMPGTWYERPLWSPATTFYIGRNLTLTGGENHPLTYDATSVEFGPQVTTINPALFYSNSKLASIIIGNGVTTIGESAFLACGQSDEVTETVVTMGSNVTSIGTNAFKDCTHIKSVTLPSKLTTIGNEAFNGSSLTSISIPASVMTIGDAAFQGCGSLASITIEDSETPLTMPGTWYERPLWSPATTFYIGRNLTLTGGENHPLTYDATSVEFGPQVTTINPALFYSNSKLASIIIGNGVTTIGESAFLACGQSDEVTETVVTMGSNVTSIGINAFQYCTHIKSVTLPSTLTTIGNEAFRYSGLTSISIPASVTSIGDAAFQDCGSMASITIEDSETPLTMSGAFYSRPFNNRASTIYIGRNLTLTGEENYPLLTEATSVEFGPKVTTINPALFYGNKKLASITFGSGVTTIGESAFYMCGTYWDEENNQGVEELEVTMGSNVTSIGTNAFQDCSKLKAITLPSKLTTIGNGAFTNSGLTSISIPASVMTIGDAAFGGCNSMTSITIEDSESPLTMTGSWYQRPFWNSATSIYLGRNVTLTEEVNPIFVSATSVEFGSKVTEISAPISGLLTNVKTPWLTPITIDEGIFNDTELENATLWVPGGTMDAYEAADNWKEFAHKDFASFVVSITASAHGTLAVADISSTNNETKTTLIDRETDAVFTVTPATGYELTTFTVNGDDETPTEGSYTVEDLSADQTVVAGFTPITYTLTYTLNGGTATNPATYTIETTTFTLNNPTKAGYDFAGWKLNGVGDAMMTVTIAQGSTGDKAYTATWTEQTYTVSITGAGVSADNMNPKYGDDVVITIAEDEDRTLNTLTVNGEDVTAYVVDGQYTIHNVTGNVVVVATFNATKEFITLAQGVGTFSCAQDLNFTGSGLKAYIAAGYNKSSKVVLLVRVYDIPAGTGLYLKGEAGVTYKIPYSTSQAYYVNMLKANLTASSIAKTSGDMSNFLLNKVDGEYGFFAPSETATLGAQKAYLQVPTSFMSGSEEARAISIAFEDDGTDITTNISDFELFTNSNEHLYNLKGQRVEKAGRGLYIKNGKKVVIK